MKTIFSQSKNPRTYTVRNLRFGFLCALIGQHFSNLFSFQPNKAATSLLTVFLTPVDCGKTCLELQDTQPFPKLEDLALKPPSHVYFPSQR